MKKLSFFIIVLALVLGGVGFWVWQSQSYSKEILKVEILAPEQVTMGQEITYQVKYKNNGDVRLESPVLTFEYPEGAIVPGEKERVIQDLEDIYPGQEQTILFSARLFGKEGQSQTAKVLLQYQPKNLQASFQSETTATTIITHVPINFDIDIATRIESSQAFSFAMNYFSNSDYPLSSLRLMVEYPAGFIFQEATPAPLGEQEWNIGVLNKAEGGRVSVQGYLEGSVQEVKIFKATLGTWKEGKFTALKEITKGVEITEPKLLVSQTVNGSESFSATPGDVLHYVVSFKNVSERTFENLFLIATLEGRPYDISSIKSQAGKVQEGDNSILWESKDVPKLRFLGKGEEGRVEFWVNVKEEWETFSSQDKNFLVRNRILLSDVKEEFEVKVNTKLGIDQTVRYADEVFGNQGPFPAQAGQQTTYTVTWQASNLGNDTQAAKVKAVLPAGVNMTGKTFPQEAVVTFDSASREVVWEIGELASGKGKHNPAVSVSFQIAATPQTIPSQLILQATISGEDTFTQNKVSATDTAVDTNL